ncbi:MAG: lipase family protein [Rhodanobacteraceae bacterium]|nr:lipase family protein [Rhodanobacteraceae bacterium]
MRPLPAPTLTNLYPPIPGFRYFDAPAGWVFDTGTGLGDARLAWWLAEHALLAYERAGPVEQALAGLGYRVYQVRHRASGGVAYAAIGADHGILAFRGTEALKPGDPVRKLGAVARDWWTDARVKQVPCALGGRVHQGFQQALDSLWADLAPVLRQAPRWWCCGHSLGGALAALAAARVAEAATLAGTLTYGQPRVGDADLARHLDTLPLLRIVNASDLVPDMPPEALGYRHAGQLRHLNPERHRDYGQRMRDYFAQLQTHLRSGLAALTPIELVDHAPLGYVVKVYNEALRGG